MNRFESLEILWGNTMTSLACVTTNSNTFIFDVMIILIDCSCAKYRLRNRNGKLENMLQQTFESKIWQRNRTLRKTEL